MSVLHYSSSVEFKKNLREGRSFDKKKKKKIKLNHFLSWTCKKVNWSKGYVKRQKGHASMGVCVMLNFKKDMP